MAAVGDYPIGRYSNDNAMQEFDTRLGPRRPQQFEGRPDLGPQSDTCETTVYRLLECLEYASQKLDSLNPGEAQRGAAATTGAPVGLRIGLSQALEHGEIVNQKLSRLIELLGRL